MSRINVSSKMSTVIVTSIHNYFSKLEKEIGLSLNLNQYIDLEEHLVRYDVLYLITQPLTHRIELIKRNISNDINAQIKKSIYKDVQDSKTLYQLFSILDDYVLDDLTQVINNDLTYFMEQNDNDVMEILDKECRYPIRRKVIKYSNLINLEEEEPF